MPPAALPRRFDPDRHQWGRDPGAFDRAWYDRVAREVGRLYGDRSWFRLSIKGWEHIPPQPALMVSNHSGGTSIPDVWGFMIAWMRHFDTHRILHPLAHDLIFALGPIAESFARLGVLRARPELAERVLTEWRRDVLVCPGGDRDTWRPHRDRYRVTFAGRRGYARLALRTGIPVTPVANAGAHDSLLVLTDGRAIARALHLPELFRAEIFPVHLSVPWGLAVGPLPHIPLPVHLRYRIGPTVAFPAGWIAGEPSAEMVEAYDAKVIAAIQALLDTLKAEQLTLRRRVRRVIEGLTPGASA